jgi:hypothetical protein
MQTGPIVAVVTSTTPKLTWSARSNASNAATNTTPTFQLCGSYLLQVVIQDAAGATASSSVAVHVNQTSTNATVTPGLATIKVNATQQFAAEILNEFCITIIPSPGPAIGWTDLTNTQLQNVCPPDFYQSQNYPFSTECNKVITAWNSAIKDTKRMIIWGRSQNKYYGNEVYLLNLAETPPTLTRSNGPSPINTDPGASPPAPGVANGSIVTPTIGPAGFVGRVVGNGAGSVNFAPAQVGNGVYFQSSCSNTRDAYYKFTGASIGKIFKPRRFYLESRYGFAQRSDSGSPERYSFDVRDRNGTHLFESLTQVAAVGSGFAVGIHPKSLQ